MQTEPLWKKLNRKWERMREESIQENYGMSYADYEVMRAKEYIASLPEEEQKALHYAVTHPNSNKYKDIASEDFVTCGVTSNLRRREINNIGGYFSESGWFYGE